MPSPDASQRESVLSLSQSEGGGVREGHLRALEAERGKNKLLEMKVAAYEQRSHVCMHASQSRMPLSSKSLCARVRACQSNILQQTQVHHFECDA